MPVEPVSATLAVASLAIELLEGVVELYRVVSAAENMPQEYRFWRTKLLMEYGRLTTFRNAAGLIQRETDDLPGSLNSDKLTLSAILTEMKVLMEGFRNMVLKYEEVDKSTQKLLNERAEKTENLVAEFDTLSYDEKLPVVKKDQFTRRFWSKTKSLATSTKDVVTHPKRFVWVLFDAEEVAKRIGRLTELNDYLEGLLHGREAILLQAGTQRMQLDIVMVKNTVEHLEHLFMASILLQERKNGYSPSGNVMREHNDKILAALARSKQLRLAGDPDSQLGDSPPSYASNLDSSALQYKQILDLDHTIPEDGHKVLAGCKLKTQSGEGKSVWVEWRAYKTTYNESSKHHFARSDQVKRVQLLVALLNVENNFKNLEMFCLPTCLGYFDDRGEPDDLHAENPHRFGLVFERPPTNLVPESLYSLLDKEDYPMPSLTSRISLACKISNCLLYLHAISWLHHNIRSESIIFLNSSDISQPLLSGFDYSRPDTKADQTTPEDARLNETEKTKQRLMDLSRHPFYQGLGKKPPYCKSFDVYGLGIVLLEIALWQRIEDLVEYPALPAEPKGTETEQEKSDIINKRSEVAERQEELAAKLKETLESPDSEDMNLVKIHFGVKYHRAVLSCIEGRKAFDIDDDESEMDLFTGTKFQRAFSSLVVEALEQIQV